MPLIAVLVLTRVLNAIPLLPLLIFMYLLAHDRQEMGGCGVGGASAVFYLVIIGLIATCPATLAIYTVR